MGRPETKPPGITLKIERFIPLAHDVAEDGARRAHQGAVMMRRLLARVNPMPAAAQPK
jgi:hypothetical protein